MSTSAKSSHGFTIKYSTDDITYYTVPDVADIKLPTPEGDEADSSDHSSVWKTIIPGMIDPGTFEATVHFRPDNAVHNTLRGLRGTMIYLRMIAPAAITTNNQVTQYGLLKQFGPEDAKLGSVLDGPFVVKGSGAPVLATV